MVVLKKQGFSDIEGIWRRLFENSSAVYQTASFELHAKWRRQAILNEKALVRNLTYYVAYDNDEPVCIIPLYDRKGIRQVAARGYEMNYPDFVYADSLTDEQMTEIIKALKKEENGTVHIVNTHQDSKIVSALRALGTECTVQEECVHIPFGDDYGEYCARFTRNTRQNINKAHNRLARDNKPYSVETFFRDGVPDSYRKPIARIAAKRMQEILGDGKSRIPLKYVRARYFFPSLTFISKTDYSFSSVIMIGDEMAGFMFGMIRGNTVVIPKIAHDSAFSAYSPGLLLVSDTIKYLIENTDIRVLDLSNGTERYKFDMGGTSHFVYRADIVCGGGNND